MKKILRISLPVVLAGFALMAFVISPKNAVLKEGNTVVHSITVANANIHFVGQNGQWLMIDSGIPGDEQKILRKMKRKKIDPNDVKYLLLTHGHYDHAGNVQFFQENYGIKVIAGQADTALFATGKNGTICPTGWLAKRLLKSAETSIYPTFQADILVDKDFDLAQIGFEGSIRNYSSHTQGSLVVFIESFAFLGDLIRGGVVAKKRPTTHFFICDLKHNHEELQAIANEEGIEHWLLGHFGPLKKSKVQKYLDRKKDSHSQ